MRVNRRADRKQRSTNATELPFRACLDDLHTRSEPCCEHRAWSGLDDTRGTPSYHRSYHTPDGTVDRRTDIFAMDIVLYKLTMGLARGGFSTQGRRGAGAQKCESDLLFCVSAPPRLCVELSDHHATKRTGHPF
jgi:hypothetical protein